MSSRSGTRFDLKHAACNLGLTSSRAQVAAALGKSAEKDLSGKASNRHLAIWAAALIASPVAGVLSRLQACVEGEWMRKAIQVC